MSLNVSGTSYNNGEESAAVHRQKEAGPTYEISPTNPTNPIDSFVLVGKKKDSTTGEKAEVDESSLFWTTIAAIIVTRLGIERSMKWSVSGSFFGDAYYRYILNPSLPISELAEHIRWRAKSEDEYGAIARRLLFKVGLEDSDQGKNARIDLFRFLDSTSQVSADARQYLEDIGKVDNLQGSHARKLIHCFIMKGLSPALDFFAEEIDINATVNAINTLGELTKIKGKVGEEALDYMGDIGSKYKHSSIYHSTFGEIARIILAEIVKGEGPLSKRAADYLIEIGKGMDSGGNHARSLMYQIVQSRNSLQRYALSGFKKIALSSNDYLVIEDAVVYLYKDALEYPVNLSFGLLYEIGRYDTPAGKYAREKLGEAAKLRDHRGNIARDKLFQFIRDYDLYSERDIFVVTHTLSMLENIAYKNDLAGDEIRDFYKTNLQRRDNEGSNDKLVESIENILKNGTPEVRKKAVNLLIYDYFDFSENKNFLHRRDILVNIADRLEDDDTSRYLTEGLFQLFEKSRKYAEIITHDADKLIGIIASQGGSAGRILRIYLNDAAKGDTKLLDAIAESAEGGTGLTDMEIVLGLASVHSETDQENVKNHILGGIFKKLICPDLENKRTHGAVQDFAEFLSNILIQKETPESTDRVALDIIGILGVTQSEGFTEQRALAKLLGGPPYKEGTALAPLDGSLLQLDFIFRNFKDSEESKSYLVERVSRIVEKVNTIRERTKSLTEKK